MIEKKINRTKVFSNHRQFQNWTLHLHLTELLDGLPDSQLCYNPAHSHKKINYDRASRGERSNQIYYQNGSHVQPLAL